VALAQSRILPARGSFDASDDWLRRKGFHVPTEASTVAAARPRPRGGHAPKLSSGDVRAAIAAALAILPGTVSAAPTWDNLHDRGLDCTGYLLQIGYLTAGAVVVTLLWFSVKTRQSRGFISQWVVTSLVTMAALAAVLDPTWLTASWGSLRSQDQAVTPVLAASALCGCFLAILAPQALLLAAACAVIMTCAALPSAGEAAAVAGCQASQNDSSKLYLGTHCVDHSPALAVGLWTQVPGYGLRCRRG
jgi:hypothetical protein